MRNGVKQDGIMSPTLFAMYFNRRLEQYNELNVGRHIGDIFLGAFSYAGDIILLAPTQTALDIMLRWANLFEELLCLIQVNVSTWYLGNLMK